MGQIKKTLPLICLTSLWLGSSPAALGQTSFIRGDANQDREIDIGDSIKTLLYMFQGSEALCLDALDTTDDGTVDLTDVIRSLSFLFLGGPAPAEPGLSCGVDPTPDELGCDSFAPCFPEVIRQEGQSEFSTPIPDNSMVLGPAGAEDGRNAEPGAPAPAPDGQSNDAERLIEEADLYKVVGDSIYVLNRYRGLYRISLQDLENPEILDRAPIFGHPIEMYVREDKGQAYVLVSDYFTFWRDPGAMQADVMPRWFYGSQLRIVDLETFEVVGGINLEGYLSDSRIVGDVMYVVSQRYSWYYRYYSDDDVDKTQILSIDIRDPSAVHVVDRKDFPRNGWQHHIHVNQNAIYLASTGYDSGSRDYRTSIRYIDITDPGGTILLRGAANVSGQVLDRWCMDEHEKVLRVASSRSWWNGDVYLSTFSVENPDEIKRLGLYVLNVNERLTSARFDGNRGYLVSYRMIDPLFVFDLEKPEQPRLLGELEMTGWLDFMVPLGDRVVALGHEDVDVGGVRTRSLAVSLIDVEEKPVLLSRVAVGENWGWIPGDRDDFAKVFKVLPHLGLILFPFQSWSREESRYIGGVQLIDLLLDEDRLALQGLIRDSGWVERGIPYGDTAVLTLSTTLLQTVDITDRGKPEILGKLELARNVQDFALLGEDHTVQLAGDWWSGDTRLLTTTADDPNAAKPLGELRLPAPYCNMFSNGDMAYITSVRELPVDPGEQDPDDQTAVQWATHIQVVDLSDPANPVERGSLTLPKEFWFYRNWYWGWGDEVVQVGGSTLVFHDYYQYFWLDCLAPDCRGVAGGPGEREHEIYIADLSDPDHPRLASKVTLTHWDWVWGIKASGSMVYLSSYRTLKDGDGWISKYYLHRIDVSDPDNPILYPQVSIPGYFVNASPGGKYLYTSEQYWDGENQISHNLFHVLELQDDRAVLLDSVEIPGYSNGFEITGDAAVTVAQEWGYRIVNEDTGQREYFTKVRLLTIDLSDPGNISIAAKVEIPTMDSAYLRKVEGGRAFLGYWAGLLVYDVTDIHEPVFEDLFRTQGWAQDIVLRRDQLYVNSGFYGIQVLDLSGDGE